MFEETDIVFSAIAYCKMMLHAAKYPHCAVNGFLLAKASKNKTIEFVDAVPLFHISLNLLPMAEIALIQVDEYASQEGLVIAGYYVAQENLKDNSFERANHRIYEKILSHYSSACLVVVDNSKLSLALDNVALKVAQCYDGNFKSCEISRIALKPQNTLDICSHLLEDVEVSSTKVNDFDNHLDDVSLNWINSEIKEDIHYLVKAVN